MAGIVCIRAGAARSLNSVQIPSGSRISPKSLLDMHESIHPNEGPIAPKGGGSTDFGNAPADSSATSSTTGSSRDEAGAHVAIQVRDPNDREHDDPEHQKAGGSALTLREGQLVELSLESITYAPVTRSAAAAGGFSAPRLGSSVEGGRTTVLSNVTTSIAPYSLNAWMGPSGCGKTSLVSVAAGLISDPSNDLVGDSRIRINGERGSLPKRLVGVVWQDDLLLSNLTVRETVRFAARLKTPGDVSDEEVELLVDSTISELGLSHVEDSLIGKPGGGGGSRGISGGERKRVAVAVELVARPTILLLDEPTSGLDASTAYQLMLSLKKLARLGHSIAVVIHQPRTSIFNMFDNLLLLSKGKAVYEGPPENARDFLESCDGVGALPPETGKADWIMDVINEDEGKEGGGELPSLWKEFCRKDRRRKDALPPSTSDAAECPSGQLRQRRGTTTTPPSDWRKTMPPLSTLKELEEDGPKFQSSFWVQLKLLAVRASRQQRGQRLTLVALILTFSWTAFTCLAWGRLPDTTTYIFSRASLLFFLIIAQSNSVVNTSLVIFSSERRLLSRERAKKMYGVLPYFIAMTFSDMMNSVALPTLYGVIVYWICNLRASASHFFAFVLILYLTISAAQSTGLFLSVLIPNTSVALMLAPLLTICLMIIGGFYMPLDLISPALSWASWLSMARYGFSAFIINEFGDKDIPCGDRDDAAVECPMPGDEVIASYGIEGAWTSIWANVSMLVAIQVVLRVSTYILLLRSK